MLNYIKRILKIGGPQIELVTRNSRHFPSETIRGELLITAPDYRQKIKSITINLKEFWTELPRGRVVRPHPVKSSRYRRHDSITVANDFVFLPGMKYQFPFEMRLPINCRVSSEESGWRSGVVIRTSGWSVIRADFNMDVQLSKVLQEIIRAVEKNTKFTEVSRGRKYIPDFSATRFVFQPPEYLQTKLQYFILDVSLTEEGGIKGSVLFNVSGNGPFSQWMTDAGENSTHEFQIEPIQSSDSESLVDSQALTNLVSDKLEEILRGKNVS